MKNTIKATRFLFVMFLVLTLAGLGNAYAEDAKENQDKNLIKVEPIKVCMVNDRLFEKDQIPVKVEERTYYGCCKMCEQTLKERAEFRTALDPVSGKKVDKAAAVIGALPDGTTLYFENEKNLESYKKGNKK